MAYLRLIFILCVLSFCNNISSSVIPTESINLLAKNATTNISPLPKDSKRDRIGFDNLKFFTVVRDDKNDTIFGFDEYYNLTQIYRYLDYLQQKYKNIVKILPIGQTWENRTIKTLKISSGNSNNSAIWIDGGIHAREWISVSSVLFTMNTLLTNWYSLDEAFRNVDYYITPVLNPDGYEFSHNHERFWRLNRRKLHECYGVDLNRNFPYKWLTYKDPLGLEANYTRSACTNEYAGVAPSSEPETKAVIEFISKFPNDKFKRKWKEREERLIEECQHLKKELSSVSLQKVKNLQSKLNTANEMINKLNENYRNATEEWTKREMKLIEECNHLKYQITNTPKVIAPDVERLQEQLKDSQEINLKLKFDFDSCKDKCTALEHLCSDLKKVIMDEQIAEKLYANDNIPATVKQFLSSSSSSVINTLSHVFGCLSKSSARNKHRDGSLRKELFTTNESLMINDLSRTFEHNEIIKELIKEKEHLKKENLDLNRQVKELEQIVRRRAHPNFSHVSEIIKSNESKQYEQESETIKNLKKELLEKQHVIIDLKNQLVESKAKYDQNLLNLQGKVVNIQEESIKMKEELDKRRNVPVNHGPKCKRRGRTCDPPPPSVRNFRMELSAKEREIQALNKQLEEMKKTNRKLTKERGQYVSYLSSKEQSADDIHFSRRLPSEANSEMNSPDKPITDFISRKNSHVEFQNDYNDNDVVDLQNSKNIEETIKSKPTNIEQNKKNLNVASKDPNDYKSLSDKLNFLEEKHQSLQQITCNLLTLFAKDGIENCQNKLTADKDTLDQREELNRFVSALKEFSN